MDSKLSWELTIILLYKYDIEDCSISIANALEILQPSICICRDVLPHLGLVTPYGDMELGQHWLR